VVTVEPCIGCGDETSIGSVLYAGRHCDQQDDGTSTYRCEECTARTRPEPGERTSDDDQMGWLEKGVIGWDLRQNR